MHENTVLGMMVGTQAMVDAGDDVYSSNFLLLGGCKGLWTSDSKLPQIPDDEIRSLNFDFAYFPMDSSIPEGQVERLAELGIPTIREVSFGSELGAYVDPHTAVQERKAIETRPQLMHDDRGFATILDDIKAWKSKSA